MNICFYTAEQPSATSLLNMHYLIEQRPQHNYTFLKIRSTPQVRSGFVERLKKIYGEWRFDDGRFDFGRDVIAIDKRLKKNTPRIDHTKFRTAFADTVNDTPSEQFLKEIKPDIIIQAGAGILKENIFSLAAKATINLHHGIAPEIRGIESTLWCMYYGIKDKIGVTCHFIDATLDTGIIIKQQALNSKSTTLADIQYENSMLGREVLLQGVDILDKGNYGVHSGGQVASYYFGLPGPTVYPELKKRNFQAVKEISGKPFKMKEKKYLQF
ncbi:MAG: arnA [Flavipsychrobacter sp.]|jgi:folate-dependent phosphoribosylglycinamide formyltransferase PurN|nr:arnA [Flavipsychrobacter sp.]